MTFEVPFALSSLIPNVSMWLPKEQAGGLPMALVQRDVGWSDKIPASPAVLCPYGCV